MRHNYAQTEEVIVWLGEENDDSNVAMNAITESPKALRAMRQANSYSNI
jgi:hypothetical protein